MFLFEPKEDIKASRSINLEAASYRNPMSGKKEECTMSCLTEIETYIKLDKRRNIMLGH